MQACVSFISFRFGSCMHMSNEVQRPRVQKVLRSILKLLGSRCACLPTQDCCLQNACGYHRSRNSEVTCSA